MLPPHAGYLVHRRSQCASIYKFPLMSLFSSQLLSCFYFSNSFPFVFTFLILHFITIIFLLVIQKLNILISSIIKVLCFLYKNKLNAIYFSIENKQKKLSDLDLPFQSHLYNPLIPTIYQSHFTFWQFVNSTFLLFSP